MRHIILLATFVAVSAGCSKILGIKDVTIGSEAPRLIAPLSMSTVTQQKPTLRWVLGAENSTPVVDLCQDRSCTMPLPVTTQLANDNLSAVPAVALPAGWVFWRVRVTSGSQTVTSATWQFWVGKSSASTPVDTSNGAILDVNGDGYPDFLIGADSAGAGMGTVHLYLGSASASVTEWNAASTAGRLDLTNPDGTNAAFGYSVASAGDVNGDGYADFLVGAYGTGANSGSAHLYLGSATPSANTWNMTSTPERVDLRNLDGGDAIFGASVAGAGDVNGDGYADFLIGASKAGVIHLYLGSATPSATDWNQATFTGRIDLTSPDVLAAFGNAVASAGDVNGDGYADFLVGDDGANGAEGATHLYLGSAVPSADAWNNTLSTERVDLTNPDGADASFGYSVASAGDVNGDGYSDFLIGALGAGSNSGVAHLYFGSATPSAIGWNRPLPTERIDLTNPDGTTALFGASVASAGDVNGDGYADFLVGAEGESAGAGAAHLYLGTATPSETMWNGPSSNRITLANPDATGTRFGASVTGAGDVNGDGLADFLIGAHGIGSLGGAAHLYLGSTTPSATAWSDASSTGRMDVVNPDGVSARFGVSVASAGNLSTTGIRSSPVSAISASHARGRHPLAQRRHWMPSTSGLTSSAHVALRSGSARSSD